MKYLFTILLFIAFSVKAQVAFQLNKSYPVGYVVYYPSANVKWISLKPFVATSYPSEGVNWTRYGIVLSKTDTIKLFVKDTTFLHDTITRYIPDPNTVTRATIDSIDKRMKLVEALPFALTQLSNRVTVYSLASSTVDTLKTRVKALENPPMATYKISLTGAALFKLKNDTTNIIKSIVPGKGIKIDQTDSTVIINTQ